MNWRNVVFTALMCLITYDLALAAENNPIFAVAPNDVESAKNILKTDPAAINARDEDGSTPLIYFAKIQIISVKLDSNFTGAADNVAKDDSSSVAVFLIRQGANVNAHDNNGLTPLHWAISREKWPLVEYLLDNGADVNATIKKLSGFEGLTPLMLVSGFGNTNIMQILITKNADLNVTDKYGNTALHSAAEYGHFKAVKLLIENNATMDLKNLNGDTPLSLATKNKHTDIEKFIRSNLQ